MPRADDAPLPLAHLRVMEAGGGAALAYAGKLFADFGATVVKLEPPGGDPMRAVPPLVETGAGPQSALFAWLNTNKRSVTRAPDPAQFDVLLDARPAAARGGEAPITALISWFGENGPYAGFAATDVTLGKDELDAIDKVSKEILYPMG